MDFLEEHPDYEKTILLVAALDRGLTYRQEMMELDTQYYNLQENLEN